MHAFVTGGAGFIGSTLVNRLLLDGHAVVPFDNFSTGLERFLEYAVSRREFMLVRGDARDSSALTSAMRGLEQNTIATFNVLRWITGHLGLTPTLDYSGGDRTRRIRALDWKPSLSIRDAVVRTVDDLRTNPAILEMRG